MIRRPPRSTPFPTRRSSDLHLCLDRLDRQREAIGDGTVRPPLGEEGEDLALARREHRKALTPREREDRKSTRLNSSHLGISYAVFCLKKKNKTNRASNKNR